MGNLGVGLFLFCMFSVGSAGFVTTEQTSTSFSFESCIEADLVQIEALKLEFFSKIPSLYLEGDTSNLSFGLKKEDWDRLKLLERQLPKGSLMKTRLVKAFRLLVAALYQAHAQQRSETYGDPNKISSTDIPKEQLYASTKESDKTNIATDVSVPVSEKRPNINSSIGGNVENDNEIAGSDIEEVAIPSPSFDNRDTSSPTPLGNTTGHTVNVTYTEGLNTDTNNNEKASSGIKPYTPSLVPTDGEVKEFEVTESTLQSISEYPTSKTGQQQQDDNDAGLHRPVAYKPTDPKYGNTSLRTDPSSVSSVDVTSGPTHGPTTEAVTYPTLREYNASRTNVTPHPRTPPNVDSSSALIPTVGHSSSIEVPNDSFYDSQQTNTTMVILNNTTTENTKVFTNTVDMNNSYTNVIVTSQNSVQPPEKPILITNGTNETTLPMQTPHTVPNTYLSSAKRPLDIDIENGTLNTSQHKAPTEMLNDTSTGTTPIIKTVLLNSPSSDHPNLLQPTTKYNEITHLTTTDIPSTTRNEKLTPSMDNDFPTKTPNIIAAQPNNTTMTTKLPTTSLPSYFDNSLYDMADSNEEYGDGNRIFYNNNRTDNPESKVDIDVSETQQPPSTTAEPKERFGYFTIVFNKYIEKTKLKIPIEKLNIFPKTQYQDKSVGILKDGCGGRHGCVRVKNLQYKFFDLPHGREVVENPSFAKTYNLPRQKIPSSLDQDSEYYKWICKMIILGRKSGKR